MCEVYPTLRVLAERGSTSRSKESNTVNLPDNQAAWRSTACAIRLGWTAAGSDSVWNARAAIQRLYCPGHPLGPG